MMRATSLGIAANTPETSSLGASFVYMFWSTIVKPFLSAIICAALAGVLRVRAMVGCENGPSPGFYTPGTAGVK
ncbi:hypothetical protein ATCV1_z238R [Acanthocystis turfacea chlorella virus 1]|uniref:Uncharacterized protein z238R n=1 Tax=Chlorovirus heliozoae TaxID=322019 RepID=A7K8J8_9PHYC|nr:hypothetical protein ATCV1_z238R [Acanthocystis turfacea chlorella virus 1]ABT16372.1 hypothetical protein ATCV1_z238R [Acanthocystis turfacea chlorella virus 1]